MPLITIMIEQLLLMMSAKYRIEQNESANFIFLSFYVFVVEIFKF